MKIRINQVLPLLGLFMLLTGVSYVFFAKFLPSGQGGITGSAIPTSVPPVESQPGVLTFQGPKTEMCPINGLLYTKEEQQLWSTSRPLLVMIENSLDSRPQSGLANADIVYEAVAEGGVTRFMAVYYCAVQKGTSNKYDVGPVRSARTYFLDLASEYSDYPLYAHVGGANCSAATPGGPCTTNKRAQAVEQIASYGWNNKGTWGDLSQFSLSYKVCRREPERTGEVRDTEHTMYCSTKELWQVAADRGLTNETIVNKNSWDKYYRPWNFKQSDSSSSSTASLISFDFWAGQKEYSVSWEYQPSSNSYLRSNGGQPHIDFNNQKQITAKNLVVQLVKETRSVDEHKHNLYEVIGSGKGLLFQNGTKVDITWSKPSRGSRTIYKTTDGKEINFVPGTIWVEIVPKDNQVIYEDKPQS